MRHLSAWVCAAALTGAAVAAGAAAAGPGPAPHATRTARLGIGVDLATGLYSTAAVTAWTARTGVRPDPVQSFVSWRYAGQPVLSAFNATRAGQIAALGATPEITWEPQDAAGGVNQPDFRLAQITAGRYDAYIRTFATAIKHYGRPVLLRLAHEMNGTWLPWGEGVNGNRPGDYVRMWRHVHDIFTAAGVKTVSWVWSPDILPAGGRALSQFYPGDAYVDQVGIDGYAYPLEGCRPAATVFGPTVTAARSISTRPVTIAEMAVAAACPDKPGWITAMFAWLAGQPAVTGLIWWDRQDSDQDWRIDSSPASLAAFRAGALAAQAAPVR